MPFMIVTKLPIFDPHDAARRLCQHWSGIFRARDDGIPEEQDYTMLSFVVPAPRDMNWTSAFEEVLASKSESAPGPDGLPESVYRSAGGIGAQFLSPAHEAMLLATAPWAGCGASGNVFITHSGDTNAQVLLIRTRLCAIVISKSSLLLRVLAFGSTPISASIRLKDVWPNA